jgi:hypothetical protein
MRVWQSGLARRRFASPAAVYHGAREVHGLKCLHRGQERDGVVRNPRAIV